jgi:hypothetical protein
MESVRFDIYLSTFDLAVIDLALEWCGLVNRRMWAEAIVLPWAGRRNHKGIIGDRVLADAFVAAGAIVPGYLPNLPIMPVLPNGFLSFKTHQGKEKVGLTHREVDSLIRCLDPWFRIVGLGQISACALYSNPEGRNPIEQVRSLLFGGRGACFSACDRAVPVVCRRGIEIHDVLRYAEAWTMRPPVPGVTPHLVDYQEPMRMTDLEPVILGVVR